jgi:hypothetical protein
MYLFRVGALHAGEARLDGVRSQQLSPYVLTLSRLRYEAKMVAIGQRFSDRGSFSGAPGMGGWIAFERKADGQNDTVRGNLLRLPRLVLKRPTRGCAWQALGGRGGGSNPLIRPATASESARRGPPSPPGEGKHRSGRGRGAPKNGHRKFSLRSCGPGSGGRGEASLGGSVEHKYPIRSPLAIRVGSGEDVST